MEVIKISGFSLVSAVLAVGLLVAALCQGQSISSSPRVFITDVSGIW